MDALWVLDRRAEGGGVLRSQLDLAFLDRRLYRVSLQRLDLCRRLLVFQSESELRQEPDDDASMVVRDCERIAHRFCASGLLAEIEADPSLANGSELEGWRNHNGATEGDVELSIALENQPNVRLFFSLLNVASALEKEASKLGSSGIRQWQTINSAIRGTFSAILENQEYFVKSGLSLCSAHSDDARQSHLRGLRAAQLKALACRALLTTDVLDDKTPPAQCQGIGQAMLAGLSEPPEEGPSKARGHPSAKSKSKRKRERQKAKLAAAKSQGQREPPAAGGPARPQSAPPRLDVLTEDTDGETTAKTSPSEQRKGRDRNKSNTKTSPVQAAPDLTEEPWSSGSESSEAKGLSTGSGSHSPPWSLIESPPPPVSRPSPARAPLSPSVRRPGTVDEHLDGWELGPQRPYLALNARLSRVLRRLREQNSGLS